MMSGPLRGRGASVNPPGRFERLRCEPCDDGWQGEPDCAPPRPETELRMERARRLLTRNDSPDLPFAVSINPYRGCEHGCIYCYARPSHNWLGLSSGLDFETRIFAKANARDLLAAELDRIRRPPQPIALGTNTDPYQPIERRLALTRSLLEVLLARRTPVSIVTKSALVLRDLDLLSALARAGLVEVYLSLTTLERTLARRMEPRAAAPGRRLEVLRMLAAAGIPTGVLVAPVIPGLTDHEIERILEAAADAGVRRAGWALLRLPHDLPELFDAWLRNWFPQRRRRVLRLLRECRAGRLNDTAFGRRLRGQGPYAALLQRRFERACRRLGLEARRPRHAAGGGEPAPAQLALFEPASSAPCRRAGANSL